MISASFLVQNYSCLTQNCHLFAPKAKEKKTADYQMFAYELRSNPNSNLILCTHYEDSGSRQNQESAKEENLRGKFEEVFNKISRNILLLKDLLHLLLMTILWNFLLGRVFISCQHH